MRLTRKPTVSLDFDATSCYDRIIENIASLTLQSYGQNRTLCSIRACHLQEARYILKPQLGLSQASFHHSRLYPIFGTGQGSSASPIIWCLISCKLFEAHKQYSTGAHFTSTDVKHSIKVSMIGFVDNTYIL